ncbi:YeeE/YedE thiosulfate transporter family protein [Halobacteria archaeon AArc-m2/3/4]|uniref:YeeE/YedE thiosulfate transporter family protein n=1 Tax=Natronoglomus mannanivorans TaxID=2979990 RepID=A0AAP3E0U7_9EURY|nr:YeeE/YedE thiosulfate transporter family protein [Halobacteria archaeon AArc-xg1-1]MCU4971417.1 YeeE/YedE thiosulfate transporter family protein [Halobacteria archaeon AArc-m2/3/4]
MSAEHEQHPLFMPIVFVGGLVFGFGLALSNMAQPEVVLSFLLFEDFGLLFVMFGAAIVTGITFFGAIHFLDSAPLTGGRYARRLKTLDKNVVIGGGIFGVGWGLSGICPGAAYASVGIGNLPILYGIAGMFIGAYVQGYWRSSTPDAEPAAAKAD